MNQAQTTLLIELLRDAPVGHKPLRAFNGHPTEYSHILVGTLMHEAADEIQRLQARVSELELKPENHEAILQTITNDVCGRVPEDCDVQRGCYNY
jgi:hypothetical protein